MALLPKGADMKANSEHALQYNIVRALKLSGFIVLDTDVMDALKYFGKNNANRYAYISHHKGMGYTKGQADLIVGKNGKFWALELKTATGRQSPEQREFQAMCAEKGLDYKVIRGIQEIEQFIQGVNDAKK